MLSVSAASILRVSYAYLQKKIPILMMGLVSKETLISSFKTELLIWLLKSVGKKRHIFFGFFIVSGTPPPSCLSGAHSLVASWPSPPLPVHKLTVLRRVPRRHAPVPGQWIHSSLMKHHNTARKNGPLVAKWLISLQRRSATWKTMNGQEKGCLVDFGGFN